MPLTRRRLLAGAASAGAVALAGPGVARYLSGPGQTGELLRSAVPLPKPFTVPLPLPPTSRPVRVPTGEDVHDVVARRAEVEILPGRRTQILAFDGRFPGPTIESCRGRGVVVRHLNGLGEAISVHLHGGRTPAASDGHPMDLVPPGHRRRYVYPLDQRAATLWYHDHAMDRTAPHLYAGLAGFHLHRDDEELALPLPGGDRELPLMLADRAFGPDGELLYPAHPSGHGVRDHFAEGVLGDVILVNGAPWPEAEVPAAHLRLRLLNASSARRYALALEPRPPGGAPLVQIGTDGGLLPAPDARDAVTLAPGQRADVVVDLSGARTGATYRLVNRSGAGTTRHVLRFRVTRRVRDDTRVPPRLSDVAPLRRAHASAHRTLDFRRGPVGGRPGWVIDGRPYDPRRVDLRPRLGTLELWRLRSDVFHPVHLHLVHVQVLRGDAGEPAWRDTIDLRPGGTTDVLVPVEGYEGRYVVHCHNLEHEDMAMMAEFATV